MYCAFVAQPPTGSRFWVRAIAAVLFLGSTIAMTYSIPRDAKAIWRFNHAPACSTIIASGCRSDVATRLVDVELVGSGRYGLEMGDGEQVDVASAPEQWRSVGIYGIAATVERFDGRAFYVSATGVTLPTADNPAQHLANEVPLVPFGIFLTWYGLEFARETWQALTGWVAHADRPRLQWPRRVVHAVLAGAPLLLFAHFYDPGATLGTMLIAECAITGAAFALLAIRVITKRRAIAASPALRMGWNRLRLDKGHNSHVLYTGESPTWLPAAIKNRAAGWPAALVVLVLFVSYITVGAYAAATAPGPLDRAGAQLLVAPHGLDGLPMGRTIHVADDDVTMNVTVNGVTYRTTGCGGNLTNPSMGKAYVVIDVTYTVTSGVGSYSPGDWSVIDDAGSEYSDGGYLAFCSPVLAMRNDLRGTTNGTLAIEVPIGMTHGKIVYDILGDEPSASWVF